MSSSSDKKDVNASQMKMVIGMLQNSFRVINQLISRVDELATKMDDLNVAVRRLELSDAGASHQLEKNIELLSNLVLIQVSSSIKASLTQPVGQPVFYPMPMHAGSPAPGSPSMAGSQPGGGMVAEAEIPPLITEEENLRPSSLFKKPK